MLVVVLLDLLHTLIQSYILSVIVVLLIHLANDLVTQTTLLGHWLVQKLVLLLLLLVFQTC